jgi:hypothetical protein
MPELGMRSTDEASNEANVSCDAATLVAAMLSGRPRGHGSCVTGYGKRLDRSTSSGGKGDCLESVSPDIWTISCVSILSVQFNIVATEP